MSRISGRRAVVCVPTDAIAIRIVLRIIRTAIAGISEPVRIGVSLSGVGYGRTVVDPVVDPVPVRVRSRVASIPGPIAVGIRLSGIVYGRAVVDISL